MTTIPKNKSKSQNKIPGKNSTQQVYMLKKMYVCVCKKKTKKEKERDDVGEVKRYHHAA